MSGKHLFIAGIMLMNEVSDDFMKTYYNYYGVSRDEPRYGVILNGTLTKVLSGMLGVEDIAGADLADAAKDYMKEIGLSEEELTALRENLSPQEQ